MTHNEAIEILESDRDGKTIQYKDRYNGEWIDHKYTLKDLLFILLKNPDFIRIKPEEK